MANKILIENDIGIFQIPIEKLEEFNGLLIGFYENGDDDIILGFMKSSVSGELHVVKIGD